MPKEEDAYVLTTESSIDRSSFNTIIRLVDAHTGELLDKHVIESSIFGGDDVEVSYWQRNMIVYARQLRYSNVLFI